jgi:hypothetical protein
MEDELVGAKKNWQLAFAPLHNHHNISVDGRYTPGSTLSPIEKGDENALAHIYGMRMFLQDDEEIGSKYQL